jgi:hypothetical protein
MAIERRAAGGDAWAVAFARAWAEAAPERAPAAADLAERGIVELRPVGWVGEPLAVTVRGDTVTLHPLCPFGLDYSTTASVEEARAEPGRVFARPLGGLADFLGGRAVVTVRRRRWLGFKAGWDVAFARAADAPGAEAAGAEVIAWPARAPTA